MANSKLIDVLTGLSLTATVCLDAGDENSYTSPGTSWLDVSGGGYDWFFGTAAAGGADDPTFVASADRRDRMRLDGGDRFDYDTTNETFMKNFHKDNAKFSMIAWVKTTDVSIFRYIFGDSAATTGFSWGLGSTNPANMQFRVLNAAAQVLTVSSGSVQVPTNKYVMVAIAIDESVGTNGLHLYRRDPATRQTADTTSTYSSPASGDPTTVSAIGSRGGANNLWIGDIAAFAIFDGVVLSYANLDDIYTATVNRYYPSVTADVGVFTLTGIDAILHGSLTMLANVGSFILSGIDAILHTSPTFFVDAGAFVFTGIDAVLTAARSMAAATGSFVLTGINAARDLVMSAVPAEYLLTGITTGINVGVSMIASAGSFAVTGIAAILHGSFTLVADVGNFIVYGPIILSNRFRAFTRSILPKRAPRDTADALRKGRTAPPKLEKI